jgi:hypothetical protein
MDFFFPKSAPVNFHEEPVCKGCGGKEFEEDYKQGDTICTGFYCAFVEAAE